MSIKNPDGRGSKRRKLSHDSEDAKQTRHDMSTDEDSTSDEPEHDKPQAIRSGQRQRTTSQTRKGSGSMASSGMTKSSILQVQADELLEEIRPDHEVRLRELKPVIDNVIQVIKSIPAQPPCTAAEAERKVRKTTRVSAIPFVDHQPEPDAKYKLEYRQPTDTFLRGPLIWHLGTKDDVNLEIAVQMPPEIFQEKDYLNHRALHKRDFYLACLAAGIKEKLEQEFDIHYALYDGNDLIPVIVLKSSKSNKRASMQNVEITINVTMPVHIGPIEKMLPKRNCIRTEQDSGDDGLVHSVPTPFYNSAVRSLASVTSFDQLLERARHTCDAFSDACMLGRVWLRQRGFESDVSKGGFGYSEWAYMCALLLVGGGYKGQPLFSERYSSVQLFKAMLQVLANRDLTEPLSIRGSGTDIEKGNDPVLFDGANAVNVLFKVSPWSYGLLRHEAQLSLTAVNAKSLESFELSFITKISEIDIQYDENYSIVVPNSKAKTLKELRSWMSDLYSVMNRGLGDRVLLLSLKQPQTTTWDLSLSRPKHSKHPQKVDVCLLVSPDTASRLIDQGPTAEEQEESRNFREFWGEKAELRRFRDGTITETLVWSANQPVTLQIIQYLAAHHFKILSSDVEDSRPRLEDGYLDKNTTLSSGDAFKIINNKFQDLSSKLHQMEGLPLPIRSVSPVGQALRSATIGHPIDPKHSSPIDVLIQFESSSRWPDHLLAIQHTKIAFLAKMSDLIKDSDASLDTRIGLEDADTSTTGYYNTSFLDVILPPSAAGLTPIVFRLRIHHDRELQLLQNLLTDKTLPSPTRDLMSTALLEHKRMFTASPAHTTSIRNLVTHFQPLSATIQLLKYWIASHNLSNNISDPVLEIIAAHVFLHPYPWSKPGSPTTGFLRCLHFLSRWDWASSPLIIDLSLSQDMTASQTTELETRFQAWRKLDPNMNNVAWFVGTNIDSTGTIWTQGAKPARVTASRITALAKAAITLLKDKPSTMSTSDWKSLFVSPTTDFDFVIHLKPSVLRAGSSKPNKAKFKNLQIQEDLDVDGIGHDVASLYLSDLEKAFSNSILFFHGEHTARIAGLWRPGVLGRKEWRVRLGFSSVPYAGRKDGEGMKEMAEINREGILAEIAFLGEGMVEKISVRE